MSRCATPVRISGTVQAATPQIAFETLSRRLWAASGPRCTRPRAPDQPANLPVGRCGCCYTRVSTYIKVVVRTLATPPFDPLEVLEDEPRIVPATIRHLPYLKMRVGACRGRRYPIFVDLGQAIVVPCDAALAIVAPPSNSAASRWVEAPRPGELVPQAAAAAGFVYDAWILADLECTDCCTPGDAILTDSAIGSPLIFVVPPGADQVEISGGRVGAQVDGFWVSGDGTVAGSSTIGEFNIGSGAFGQYEPRCICVAPGATHLRFTVAPNTIPVNLAWRIRP